MSLKTCIREQAQLLWKFLGFFQPPFMRTLHAVVAVWVGGQLLTSGLLGTPLAMLHVYSGLLLLLLACFFTGYAWNLRGLKRYYGYLWGETDALVSDIKQAMSFKLVAPRPGGLATMVQGLGFGALLLALFTGAGTFMTRSWDWSIARGMGEAHEVSVALLVMYICGHGIMALLHFVKWQRTVVRKPVPSTLSTPSTSGDETTK